MFTFIRFMVNGSFQGVARNDRRAFQIRRASRFVECAICVANGEDNGHNMAVFRLYPLRLYAYLLRFRPDRFPFAPRLIRASEEGGLLISRALRTFHFVVNRLRLHLNLFMIDLNYFWCFRVVL